MKQPILRLTHLLPRVTISAKAQPTRTFLISEDRIARYSRISLPCLPYESASCSPSYNT